MVGRIIEIAWDDKCTISKASINDRILLWNCYSQNRKDIVVKSEQQEWHKPQSFINIFILNGGPVS